MPFIPHTDTDVQEMLSFLNIESIESLFDEVPKDIPQSDLSSIPLGIPEIDVYQKLHDLSLQNRSLISFAGGGCYDHYIPGAVWDIATRGEFMTAYTPYQAEASQGTLQLLYEYQTMMVNLMSMEVSNASVYDGGSGLAEAILMAMRSQKKGSSKSKVLSFGYLSPLYQEVASHIVAHQGLTLEEVREIDAEVLNSINVANVLAIVIPFPDFLGQLLSIDTIVNWAHAHDILVIAQVNPIAVALLKPPGEWGEKGADIVVGDGQPLGIPMNLGGPSFGFLCSRQSMVRQMPGRIIGKTIDAQNEVGYTLTLQAREQHIRRGKATSNICTNQGLLVTVATIHMSLLGAKGLRQVALACRERTLYLKSELQKIGIEVLSKTFFHEFIAIIPDSKSVLKALADKGFLSGILLEEWFSDRVDQVLFCVTEKRTFQEIDQLILAIKSVS